jgi:hypothetical protein
MGASERIRMPRFVLWAGVAGLPVMGVILLASIGSGDPAMTIVPLLLSAVFLFLIALYVNWYLVPGPDGFTFRSALGRVRTIRYDEVVHARVGVEFRTLRLTIRAADGTRFAANPATIDVNPLVRALRERGWDLATGRR